jgi:hypothetical protein
VQLSTQFQLSDSLWAGDIGEDDEDESSGGIFSMIQVYRIASGDPNGVVTAPTAAICYTDVGGMWVKTGLVVSNTGWVCIIADG